MKRTLSIFFALALMGAAGSQAQTTKDITVTTDRFTGFTKTEMKPLPVGPAHGFPDASHTDGYAVLDLSLASGGGKVLLVVESTAKHRQFPHGADMRVLADGQRLDLGHLYLHRSTIDTNPRVLVSETLGAPIERGALAKIASAKVLEVRIGPYEATLTAQDLDRIREFVAALPPGTVDSAKSSR